MSQRYDASSMDTERPSGGIFSLLGFRFQIGIALPLVCLYFAFRLLDLASAHSSFVQGKSALAVLLLCVFTVLLSSSWFIAGRSWPLLHLPTINGGLPGALAQAVLSFVIFINYGKFANYYSDYNGKFFPGELGFLNGLYVFILAAVPALALPAIFRSPRMKRYGSKGTLVALSLIAVYGAFASFGDSLFYQSPSAVNLTPITLNVFLLSIWWMLSVELSVLFLFETLIDKLARSKKTAGNRRGDWFFPFIVMMGIWGVYLVACNPANMSLDSFAMWQTAVLGGKFVDIGFPFFLILLWRWLLALIPSPLFLACIQMVALGAISSAFFSLAQARGLSRRAALILAAFYAALPHNGFMVVTLWSNVPYTICLLSITYFILRIIDVHVPRTEMGIRSKVGMAPYAIAVFVPLVFAFRGTGFLPVTFTLLFLILSGVKPFIPRHLIAAGLAIGAIGVITGPLYRSSVETPKNAVVNSSIQPLDGLIAVSVFGGTLSDDTVSYLEEFMPMSEWENYYLRYDAKFRGGPLPISKVDGKSIDTGTLLRHYMKTLLMEPGIIIRNRLNKTDLLWDVLQPRGATSETIFPLLIKNDFGITRHETFLTRVMIKAWSASFYLAFAQLFIWRAGIYLLIAALLLVLMWAHGRGSWSLGLLPLAGEVLALMIAMIWSATRYVWPVQVIIPFVVLFALTSLAERERTDTPSV